MRTPNTAPTNEIQVRFDQSRGIVLGQTALEGLIDVLPGMYVQHALGTLALDSKGEMAITYTQAHRLGRMLLATEEIVDYSSNVGRYSKAGETMHKTVMLYTSLKNEATSTLFEEPIPIAANPDSAQRYELYRPIEDAVRELVTAAHTSGLPEKWDAQSLAQWYDQTYPAVNNVPEPVEERVLVLV